MSERAHPEDSGFSQGSLYREYLLRRYAFAGTFTKNKRVLDIPCGVGWGTSLLHAKHLVGIDISKEAIEYAKSHYSGINFLVGNMANISLCNKSVDVVVCLEGYEHVDSKTSRQFLYEVSRILTDDGILVLSCPVLLNGESHSGNPYHLHEPALVEFKSTFESLFTVINFDVIRGPDGHLAYFVGKPNKNLKYDFHQYKSHETCLLLNVGRVNYDCNINFHEPLNDIFYKVINFNYLDSYDKYGREELNKRIIQQALINKPDYVFLISYQDQIASCTLDKLNSFGIKTLIWFSDDHWRFENYSRFLAEHAFCSITTDKDAVAKYQNHGLNVIRSQWASNPRYYMKIDSSYTHNVSFIGQNYGSRKSNLESLKSMNIDIFCAGRGFSNFLQFDDIIKLFNSTKINLNLSGSSYDNNIKQIKGRIFEVPMCGGFLLSEYVEGIEEYFQIGKEIECFESIKEAADKIKYYLKHEDTRNEIAAAGHARALKEHTWQKRLSDIFQGMKSIERKTISQKMAMIPEISTMKKHILLTTSAAPSQAPFSTSEKRPPIGIGFLISVLRNAGHKVSFIDNYLRPSKFLETDFLKQNNVEYVGIYANTICYRDTLRMLYKLQYLRNTRQWNGKIIVGGPHTTVALDTIPDFVDYVVQGEGEHAILDIVEGNVTDRVVKYPRITNLDELPMPAWDYFVDLPYNWGVDWFPEKPVFTMNTSRGCPYNCTFCSVGSIWGKNYCYFSAERIVSDIEYVINKYGAKGVYFREDNFTVNRKRLVKFCNLLIEKGIKIQWACETRVSTLDKEIVELMANAGACGFYLGVESGSQRLLDFLKKDITVGQIREAFELCHQFGIKTAASVIVGVPTEEEEDIRRTIALIQDIKPTFTWFNVFVGIPNSELYRYVIDNKLFEYIDDRGLAYLTGHDEKVKTYYGKNTNASLPMKLDEYHQVTDPIISVVMAVYNGSKYLEKSIKSILSQTYQNFEFIIIDDASSDNSKKIIESFIDPRIRIISNTNNLGLTISLNKGIQAAKGKYIARMDADDISSPIRFETQLNYLENNPEIAVLGSSYYQINANGTTVSLIRVLTKDSDIRENLKKQNWFGHGTVMMQKAAVLDMDGYDENFKFAQDYDLWLRISEKYMVANIDEPLYFWRVTPSSISIQNESDQTYYAQLAQAKAERHFSNTDPLVSVIVPTHNRPKALIAAVESILSQTYRNVEIIVVNDSGDGVEKIIEEKNSECRITYVRHKKNKGLSASRNTALKHAEGKYIAYLDDDDLYHPDHLQTLVEFLEDSDFKVAYTDAYRVQYTKNGQEYDESARDIPYSSDFYCEKILVRNFIPVLCVMHEKSCIDEVGVFDEEIKRLEDWDLWIRLSQKYRFAHIKKTTCEFSWFNDGTTMSSGDQGEFIKAFEYIFSKHRSLSDNRPLVKAAQEHILASHRVQRIAEQSNGDAARIIHQLENILEIEPNILEAHQILSTLYERQNNPDMAQIHINKANEIIQKIIPMEPYLSLCYSTNAPYENTQPHLDACSESSPDDPKEKIKVGEQRVQEGHLDNAEKIFLDILASNPDHVVARNNLAYIYWKRGNKSEALQELLNAMKIAPDHRDVIWNCGQFMTELGLAEDALEVYRNYLINHPDDDDIRAAVLTLEESTDNSENDYPNKDPNEIISQGERLYQDGKFQEALSAFEKAVAVGGESALAHNNLAAVHQARGDLDKAAEHMRKALKLEPEDRDAIWNCGQILIQSGFPEDALALYEDFLSKHPDDREVKQAIAAL